MVFFFFLWVVFWFVSFPRFFLLAVFFIFNFLFLLVFSVALPCIASSRVRLRESGFALGIRESGENFAAHTKHTGLYQTSVGYRISISIDFELNSNSNSLNQESNQSISIYDTLHHASSTMPINRTVQQ